MDRSELENQTRASIETKQRFLAECIGEVEALCRLAEEVVRSGGKLMFCGNGGSSCDAAHAAGELVGWFEVKDRGPLPAIALGHEIPALTAIANDAAYEEVFSRQVEAIGKPGDLLVGISTSGGSKNVARAMKAAKAMGIRTAALASNRGGAVVDLAEVSVQVPSDSTPRIQESHLLTVHMLCAWLETAIR